MARNTDLQDWICEARKGRAPVRVVDPVPSLCGATTCSALREGRLIYQDLDHLNHFGSLSIAGLFGDMVAP